MAIINAGLSTEYKKYQDFMVSNVRNVLLTISKYVRKKQMQYRYKYMKR